MSPVDAVQFGKAISDATRQEIMRFCCCHTRTVNEIVDEIGMSQPTVSHHLAVLREAGLVKTEKQGKNVLYRLDQSRMVTCCGELLLVFAPESDATAAVKKCC